LNTYFDNIKPTFVKGNIFEKQVSREADRGAKTNRHLITRSTGQGYRPAG
jgi:hypothetical protein